MTRISSGVLPIELCDSQLMAEHREILRIPNTIKSGKAKVNLDKIPLQFKLGSGHVTFFYNKISYLRQRYLALYLECKRRNFNVGDYLECFDNVPHHLDNNWIPDSEVRNIVQKRISDRLSNMKSIRYCGQIVTEQDLRIVSSQHKSKIIKSQFIELI